MKSLVLALTLLALVFVPRMFATQSLYECDCAEDASWGPSGDTCCIGYTPSVTVYETSDGKCKVVDLWPAPGPCDFPFEGCYFEFRVTWPAPRDFGPFDWLETVTCDDFYWDNTCNLGILLLCGGCDTW